MLFTLVESFGPSNGEAWTSYLGWRGLSFSRFESIDGILRPALFRPETTEDWAQTVAPHYISDLTRARKKQVDIGRGDIVGLNFESHDESHPDFLGFDLIDGHDQVSLLTNWGNDLGLINRALSPSGLVIEFRVIRAIQEELIHHHGTDGHVEGCRIVSVYRVGSHTSYLRDIPTGTSIDFPRGTDLPRSVEL